MAPQGVARQVASGYRFFTLPDNAGSDTPDTASE